MDNKRQLAMVIDLNRCIGCQTCTITCKTMWTNRNGREYMYWNNVETHPGKGYPKDWQNSGGGFDENGELINGEMPSYEKYGIPWEYNYNELKNGELFKSGDDFSWGVNWEEDISTGSYSEDNYFFYLPRICNHCSEPACISACPNDAIFKREKDGIVLVDLQKCQGSRECISACPYKKIYFNPKISKSEKCNFCFPLIEQGLEPECVDQCLGRARFIGYLDDVESEVYKLVKEYKVALPLRGDFNTKPNVYYIPPVNAPLKFDSKGSPIEDSDRLPLKYLESLFGIEVYDSIEFIREEKEKIKRGEESEVLKILISIKRDNNV